MVSTSRTTVDTTTWASLGTGPLLIEVLGGTANLIQSDTQPAPSDVGFVVTSSTFSAPAVFAGSSTFWAKAFNGSATIASSPAVLASGSSGSSAGAVYGPNATGSAPSQPAVYTAGQDQAGNVRPFLVRTADGTQAVFVPDMRSTFSLDATKTSGAGSFVDIPLNGQGLVALKFSGLTTSGATITYTSSNDPSATPASPISSLNASTGVTSGTRTTDGETRIPIAGRTILRLAVTMAGTGTITGTTNVAGISVSGIVDIGSPIPPGANKMGGVTEADGDNVALGSRADAAANVGTASPSTSGTAISWLRGILTVLGDRTDATAVANTTTASISSWLRGILAACLGPTPSGTNKIGGVTIADGDASTIGTTTDAATASGANTTAIGALRAIRDKLLGALTITPRVLTFTTTDQTLAAAGTYSLTSDATIKFVKISVKGTGAVLYSIDSTAASAAHGVPLNGGAGASQPQGGSETFEATAVPQALTLYAIASTSVAITVGR